MIGQSSLVAPPYQTVGSGARGKRLQAQYNMMNMKPAQAGYNTGRSPVVAFEFREVTPGNLTGRRCPGPRADEKAHQ